MDCELLWSEQYYDFITSPAQVAPEAARHFESCEICRDRIESLKGELERPVPSSGIEKQLALQMNMLGRWVSCRTCRPFLPLFAGRPQRVRVDTPIRRHIDACRACREDVKSLERLGLDDDQLLNAAAFLSGDASVEADFSSEAAGLLHRIAVRVESGVATRTSLMREAPASEARFETTVRAEALSPAERDRSVVRVWARRVSAAAAVLLIAAFLYLQAPQARGFSVRDVFYAVHGIHTACIVTTYSSDSREVPIAEGAAEMKTAQEICVSDPLGLILYKSGGRSVLVNQNERLLLTRENGEIRPGHYTEFHSIRKPWGLLPFEDLDHLPPGYEWRASGETDLLRDASLKVYDLVWRQGSITRIWKGFLNSEGLPIRIESWDQIPGRPAQLTMVTEVTYPTVEEIEELLRNEGFQDYGDQFKGQ